MEIYLALDSRNFDSSIGELTECLTCVQKWMDSVKLNFNPDKTECIIIFDRHARESLMQKLHTQLLGLLPVKLRNKVLLLTLKTFLLVT